MRVELKHFGRHAALTIDSNERVVLVVGKNRSGKTTVRDAIEFALLGTCELRGFSLKKDVARYMIHAAAEKASVELVVEAVERQRWGVRRTMRTGGAQKIELDRHGNGGWVEVSAAEWAAFFPLEARAVRAALDSDSVWRASADERRRLLVALKEDGGVTHDAILAELKPLEQRTPASFAVAGLLSLLINLAVTHGFAAANARAVERRRELKRKIDGLPEVDDPIGFDPYVDGVDCREGSLDELKRGLDDARAELNAAIEARANASGRLAERAAAARERLAEADERWQALGRRLLEEFPNPDPDAEAKTVAADDLAREARLAEYQSGSLRAEQGEILEHARSLRARVDEITMAAAKNAGGVAVAPKKCPAVPFSFSCPVKPAKWAEAFEANEAEAGLRREAEALERADLERQIGEAQAEADRIGRAAAAFHEDATRVGNRAVARDQLDRDLMSAKNAYDLAVVEVGKAERAADAAGAGPSEDDLAFIAGRIAHREALLALRKRYEDECRLFAETSKLRAELAACVEWVDALEHELRPDGVEGRLASQSRSGLAETLEELSRILGTRVEITPDFDLLIDGRHVAAASKSEQRVAGALVQLAVALRVGLPFVVVDEVDALDAEWRDAFRRTADAATQEVGAVFQILGLATTDASPPGTPPEGWETAWVRPGHPVEMIEGDF